MPGVRVIDEPAKGLVVARETARRAAQTDIVAYIDADCRVPITWLERVEARFMKPHRAGGGDRAVPLLRLGLDAAGR